jgi:hypothetical protein
LFSDPEFLSATAPPPFDPKRYLAPQSDVVALMTLEHQTQMTNLLTRLSWEARIDPRARSLAARIEELARYMLFLDEAPLRAPIRGASSFAETFPREGPRDRKGRSLRDFDLEKRLFRYPLSYMVYSRQFDAMADSLRARMFRRIEEILTGGTVAEPDARAVREILQDTKPASFDR